MAKDFAHSSQLELAYDRTASSNGAFAKLVKAWESKNSERAVRGAGLGLMAISLAACGGTDGTTVAVIPVTEHEALLAAAAADVTAANAAQAVAESAAAAAEAAKVAAETQAASDVSTAAAAQAVAEAAQAVAEADAATAAQAQAAAEVAQAAAVEAQGVAESAAVAAANAQAAAETALAQLETDLAPLTGGQLTANTDTIILLRDATLAGDVTNFTASDTIVGIGGNTVTLAATDDVSVTGIASGVDSIVINLTAAATTATSTVFNVDAANIANGSVTLNVNAPNILGTTVVSGSVTNAGNITVLSGTGITNTLTVAVDTDAATRVVGGDAASVAVTNVTNGGVTVVTDASTSGISVSGTAALTDSVSVSAVGAVALNTNAAAQVEVLTLSGNGAAAVFTLDSGDAPDTITLAGTQDVTLVATSADVTTETITDSTTSGTTTLSLSAVTASTDLSAVSVDNIEVAGAITAASTLTFAAGAVSTISVAQANAFTLDINDGLAAHNTGAVTVNLDDDVTSTVTVNATANTDNINALNIVANFAQTGLDVRGGTATVNLSGSANVVADSTTTAAHLNASALAGSLTAAASASLLSITGGSGNDQITGFAGSTLVGGAGTDTLVAGAALDLTGATISGFEILDAGAGAIDFLASQVNGATYAVLNGAGLQVNNAGSINISSIDLSGLTFADATDTVTVDLTARDANVILANQGFTYVGSAARDIVTGSANADNISGGAGDDQLGGGIGNDVINGGAGADVITGGTGADVMTGGLGADVFEFSTDGSVSGTSLDVITDFNVGGADQLGFGATAVLLAAETNGTTATSDVDTSAGGLISFAAADDTLAEKIVAIQADAELDAVNSVGFFVDGANTYVYYAGAATGNADDQIIELSGITSLTTMNILIGGDVTIA